MNQAATASILIVDDNQENIDVLKGMLSGHYGIRVATSGRLALKIARSGKPPDLILLDVMMPEMDGYEVCQQLKADERTQSIPVIFVTALSDADDETRGLELGAVDYLIKPLNAAITMARIKTHLMLNDRSRLLQELVDDQTQCLVHKTLELEASRLEILRRLGRAGEYRDNETGLHVIRLSHYVQLLAKAAELPGETVERIMSASLLHDIGKIAIPDRILLKPGKLTEEEFEVIKTHTTIGAEIIGEHPHPLIRMARDIAVTHHEKWNGKGYPLGLAGTEIPLHGRMTAIADIFDALTSVRPYKEAWSLDKALDVIAKEAGNALDPELVALFLGLRPQIESVKETFADGAAGAD
ncbi:HD-GYP domain-containing protein [Thiorhodovibrio frisius]|uniref:Response regulator containing a CheY-like receiver domain and an HD-GYP domain n=1 Tax=Thiorhodovibrio frisius TaxID=631362 RepID=H8YYP6_9GAMM|nr:HD domain-containing phosphohydrolase [Thiorhodovibrio frisius]EIC23572.1 response regulator containing a CheY-like receiver domain and an HD-GYP domain [Thiorhodovibrio frisius]WPL23341.1 Cyclic di-GMP phosphodiesterase response regulator RpfG [Thiorhodovibrio frisius]